VGDWRDQTLGDVLTLQRGFDLPESERRPGQIPVIASTGAVGTHSDAMVKGPGVVIGRSGSLGGGQFIQEDFWPLNTTLWVKDFKGNDIRFCYYLLRSLDLAAFNVGSGVPTLNRNHIHPLPVHAPVEVGEQRAIAHILGALDDRIELNHQMNETLEAMVRALFKSWFVDFDPVRAKAEDRPPGLSRPLADLFPDAFEDSELGEVPKGWRVTTLGDLCLRPEYGFTASSSREPVGPKFVRITDINKVPWIEWYSVPYCETSDEEFRRYRVRTGDILIARMADPGHGVMIEVDREAVFASYLIRFRAKNRVHARYLQYWLRSDNYWQLVAARRTGTTRASLNAQVLAAFQLVVPSESLAKAFGERIGALRSSLIGNVARSETLTRLRDALLPKLVSGEIRV
jgi:type I restriction enzyme S subunit